MPCHTVRNVIVTFGSHAIKERFEVNTYEQFINWSFFSPGCPSSSRWRRRDKLDEFDEMEDEEDDDEDGHDFEDEEEETAHVEDDEQLEDILDNDLSW